MEMTKKMLKAGLAVAAAMAVMTGCGSETANETTAVETTAAAEAAGETTAAAAEEIEIPETKSVEEQQDEAEIVLGDYSELTRSIEKVLITDDYLAREMEYLRSLYPAEVTGRPAKLGDVANIDYAGYDEGVAFEGGTAEGYDLTLGSNSFIDGFEDGIVGMEIGEERDLNLTFPEQYHSEELAGKEVVFHVTLNGLSNAEETVLDDALAKRISGDDTMTLEKLEEEVRRDLEYQAEYEYYVNGGGEVLSQLVQNCEVTVDPDAVDAKYAEMVETYQAYAQMYGVTVTEYLNYFVGLSIDDIAVYAEELVKQEMVLTALIEEENLNANDEQKEVIAMLNGFESAEEMEAQVPAEIYEEAYKIGAANFFLLDNAEPVNGN